MRGEGHCARNDFYWTDAEGQEMKIKWGPGIIFIFWDRLENGRPIQPGVNARGARAILERDPKRKTRRVFTPG
jgi:hypothetical protein